MPSLLSQPLAKSPHDRTHEAWCLRVWIEASHWLCSTIGRTHTKIQVRFQVKIHKREESYVSGGYKHPVTVRRATESWTPTQPSFQITFPVNFKVSHMGFATLKEIVGDIIYQAASTLEVQRSMLSAQRSNLRRGAAGACSEQSVIQVTLWGLIDVRILSSWSDRSTIVCKMTI